MFENDTVVEQDTASEGELVYLTKEDLIGDTVVLGLIDFDPQYVGKYGTTSRARVDLFVASGEHEGTVQPDTHLFGNMASQASAIGVGNTSVGIVQSGPSKRGGTWYGLSFSVSAKDHKAALAKARKAAGSTPAQATGTDDAAPF